MSVVNARGESSRPTGSLRKQKGWIGFVHHYNKYITEGSYDEIEWDTKTKAKKVERKGSKTTYTF